MERVNENRETTIGSGQLQLLAAWQRPPPRLYERNISPTKGIMQHLASRRRPQGFLYLTVTVNLPLANGKRVQARGFENKNISALL